MPPAVSVFFYHNKILSLKRSALTEKKAFLQSAPPMGLSPAAPIRSFRILPEYLSQLFYLFYIS
jgi:hypothetical protein